MLVTTAPLRPITVVREPGAVTLVRYPLVYVNVYSGGVDGLGSSIWLSRPLLYVNRVESPCGLRVVMCWPSELNTTCEPPRSFLT
jgi:hypothetical protein